MSIRTRLILTLVAFTVLPVLVSGAILFYTISANTVQRQQDALNLVVELKQSQVQTWVAGLQAGLETEIASDASAARMPALLRSPAEVLYRALYDRQIDNFNASINTFHTFEEIFLLDPNGKVILSTDPNHEGQDHWQSVFFQNGMSGPTIQVNPPQPAGDGQATALTIIAARPVETAGGRVLGVIAGRANPENLLRLMADQAALGESGEAYLIGAHGLPLTMLKLPPQALTTPEFQSQEPEIGIAPVLAVESPAIRSALVDKIAGAGRYINYAGGPVLGAYRWIPEMQAALVAEQDERQALAPVNNIRTITIFSAIGSLLIATLAAALISRSFTRPIEELAATAEKIASGNLELRAPSGRMDEIGALAIAFNSMTAQLRVLIGSLEARVSERTRLLQNRSDQLQASVEVGRYVTSILDTNLLIQRVVDLIRERFGLYYVGLFLVDDSHEFAILRAGTGRAGQAMLQRGHHLALRDGASPASSMIGWAILNNQARVALQAEQDPLRLATPELPETRSEAAIPLRSRGQIIGAISLQSAAPGAFDKETLSIFQTMADQVATALDNARLFNQAQIALQEAQQAYTQLGHQAWLQRLRSRPITLRRQRTSDPIQPRLPDGSPNTAAAPTPRPPLPIPGEGERAAAGSSLAALRVPIKARGQVIGHLRLTRRQRQSLATEASTVVATQPSLAGSPDDQSGLPNVASSVSHSMIGPPPFDPREVNLIEALVDQMGVALDSARLFEQTQQQAERERLVGEVTGRLRASLDLQTVMQTAARELRTALDLDEVELRLGVTAPPVGAHSVRPDTAPTAAVQTLAAGASHPDQVKPSPAPSTDPAPSIPPETI